MAKFKKENLQPLIFEIKSYKCCKPTSNDVVEHILPKLKQITDNEDISYCPKSYKFIKVMTYSTSGEQAYFPIMMSKLLSGYFGCIPEKRAMQEYKKDFKNEKTSHHFLFLYLLTLEQRLNQTDYFVETKDDDQTDYPLWIWTTYNILCYHCRIFKNYEMAVTICSLLEDYISGFFSKLKNDI